MRICSLGKFVQYKLPYYY